MGTIETRYTCTCAQSRVWVQTSWTTQAESPIEEYLELLSFYDDTVVLLYEAEFSHEEDIDFSEDHYQFTTTNDQGIFYHKITLLLDFDE